MEIFVRRLSQVNSFSRDTDDRKHDMTGLVQPDGIHKDFVVLKMTGETTKTQVFRALAESGLDVESFGDYRPSLNDIFVERAGDEA